MTLNVIKNFDIKKLVLNKGLWLAFSLLMFALPIYKSVNRELPPEIPQQFKIPDFSLVDEAGKTFEWASLRGRFVLVNFYFTRCPTICKEMMTKTQEIQKRVRGLGDKVAILSISVDPEFDTPSVLNNYSRQLKANPIVWKFLTGAKKDVENVVINHFKSPMQQDVGVANVFDIAHSGSIYLIDDEGFLRSTYSIKDQSVNQMMIDLGLMVNRLYYKR